MLSVCWSEDREGCILADWYDDDRAERGGFAETVAAMDDYLLCRDDALAAEAEPDDADYDDEDAAWEPRAAVAGRR